MDGVKVTLKTIKDLFWIDEGEATAKPPTTLLQHEAREVTNTAKGSDNVEPQEDAAQNAVEMDSWFPPIDLNTTKEQRFAFEFHNPGLVGSNFEIVVKVDKKEAFLAEYAPYQSTKQQLDGSLAMGIVFEQHLELENNYICRIRVEPTPENQRPIPVEVKDLLVNLDPELEDDELSEESGSGSQSESRSRSGSSSRSGSRNRSSNSDGGDNDESGSGGNIGDEENISDDGQQSEEEQMEASFLGPFELKDEEVRQTKKRSRDAMEEDSFSDSGDPMEVANASPTKLQKIIGGSFMKGWSAIAKAAASEALKRFTRK